MADALSDERRERVVALLAAARRLVDPADPLGRRARELLPISTGLSAENVELGLREHLEVAASADEIDELVSSVPDAPRAHVLLAANVFVAPLRAIALALAQSAQVFVRPSRREPHFCRLLAEASGAFALVDELAPAPQDHVWVYGGDETLKQVRRSLPRGAVFHGHGSGFGIALIAAAGPHPGIELDRAATLLAEDVVPFDQRGCLSPRVAFVLGDRSHARAFAKCLARALAEAEARVPRGVLDPDEAFAVTAFVDSMRYAAEVLPAGSGFVSLDCDHARWVLPPTGRIVAVLPGEGWENKVAAWSGSIAALGVHPADAVDEQSALPSARKSALGRMQRPRFDGPVDRRPARSGEPV